MRVQKLLILIAIGLSFLSLPRSGRAQSPSLRHDTQVWNDTLLAIPLNKSIDFLIAGTLRIGRDVSRPVDERVGVGFAIKVGKYLTLTPAYYYIGTQPIKNRKAYENRLAFAATVKGPVGGGFVLGNRSLIERRLRHPQIDSTRYRDRVQVEHPFHIGELKLNGFMADEIFYDWSVHAWVRNRFNIGVGRNFNKHVYGEVYYLRQNDSHALPGDLNVLGTGLKFRL
ncbi:MAG TPA: DUF2490 domain-containing protein [Pyrinomonadaceae bacterium]|nr:DUF2490 domain-containing protein [Pyrinomonadaceae bacterium]